MIALKSIRKLYFKNAAGELRGLNGEDGIYATKLSGFGYSLSPSFADLGSGFFPVISEKSDIRNALAFTLILTRSPYAAHQLLVDWISVSGVLTIVYDPSGTQEYCRDVVVNFIQKGELNSAGWLELLCSFACLTPWYRPYPASLNVIGSGLDERKRYSYRYSSDLRYGADSSSAISAYIANAGHVPGALKISYRGAITNPRIRLRGNVSGKTYGMCRLTTVLTEFDTLEYSSLYENSYIRKVAANGTSSDLVDTADLSSNPFFRIPVEERCTLSVEADAPLVGRASLLIYYYYRSV